MISTQFAVMKRFGTAAAAKKYYEKKHLDIARNQREAHYILSALTDCKNPLKILDIPCGVGSISLKLSEAGHKVWAADSSVHMLAYLDKIVQREGSSGLIRSSCEDVFKTRFDDDFFDAVVCNRLLHHYPDSALRARALTELARISRGPVIVSFFWNFSLSACWYHFRNYLKGKKPVDRVPINVKELQCDGKEAGLRLDRIIPMRHGISKQTYARFMPA